VYSHPTYPAQKACFGTERSLPRVTPHQCSECSREVEIGFAHNPVLVPAYLQATRMNACFQSAEFCSPDNGRDIFAHGPDGLMVPKESGLPDGWEVHEEVLPDGRVLNVAIESASSDPYPLRPAETDLTDDSEDEEDRKFFEAYRAQRADELKARANAARFGTVLQLRFVDYEPEVLSLSRCEPSLWIVVHLFKEGHAGCQSGLSERRASV
jgi:hypothetical protein